MNNLGQYSVVSYVHGLRGERMNVGVLVWHPLAGCVFRQSRNLTRVRYIDESVDMERVRLGLERIGETAKVWPKGSVSPLEQLSLQYKHGLVVTQPQNARVHDPLSTLDELSAALLPPEPSFVRAPSTTQFANTFAHILEKELRQWGVPNVRSNFVEEGPIEPIKVTASFNFQSERYAWRAFSFSSENDTKKQLRLAKAVSVDNADLRNLDGYRQAHVLVAVQPPRPQARADWGRAVKYLLRTADRVESFEDRKSLELKLPDLLPPDLSLTLT